MCYSLTDSVVAFMVNIISSYLLFVKYTQPEIRLVALFSAYVGVMQFWDIMFWLNPGKNKTNFYSTKLATIWLHLEPIALSLIILYLFKKIKTATLVITMLYSVLLIIYMARYWKEINYTETCCGNRVVWNWTYKKYAGILYAPFFLSFLVAIYQYLDGPIRNLSLFYVSFTYLFSFIKYDIEKNTGRFWCFFGAFFPLIILIFLQSK